MAQREHFQFGKEDYMYAGAIDTTDGTTSRQQVLGVVVAHAIVGGTQISAKLEPLARMTQGLGMLDAYTRLILYAGVNGGANASYDIEFLRAGTPSIPSQLNGLTLQTFTSATPIVVDPWCDPDFLQTPGGGAEDAFNVRMMVTPADAVAREVSFLAFFCPSAKASGSGRGNVLSGNAYKVV